MWSLIKDSAIKGVTSLVHFECVAGGNCPQRSDFVISNNTQYDLTLDISELCGRECNHKGESCNTFQNFCHQK